MTGPVGEAEALPGHSASLFTGALSTQRRAALRDEVRARSGQIPRPASARCLRRGSGQLVIYSFEPKAQPVAERAPKRAALSPKARMDRYLRDWQPQLRRYPAAPPGEAADPQRPAIDMTHAARRLRNEFRRR